MNPIAFSTLACPGWSIDTILRKAVEFGYDGIEWRGGSQGHVRPSMSSREKAALRKISADAGLMALSVTTYTSFVSNHPEERQSNLDELKRYTDLAAEFGGSYVRAFLGELPDGTTIGASIYGIISDCLNAASEYAASIGVKIAVEPHDSFTRSAAVSPLFDPNSSHPDLRVIWDIGNTFAVGEDPDESFPLLRDRLAYVQVKDGLREGSTWQLCAVGQGNVPLARAFELLLAHGYDGAFSLEWEYAWHPELDPPEVALPAGIQVIKSLLAKIPTSQVMK